MKRLQILLASATLSGMLGYGLAYAAPPRVGAAPKAVGSNSSTPSSMTVTVDNSFPAEPRVDLAIIAGDTLSIIRKRFPGDPPAGVRPIVCIYDASVPEVTPTGDYTPYLIKIGVQDRQYDQFAFQLGHELGHVWLDPRRTSGLDETCAFAVSYRVLDDLAQLWASDPPFDRWRSYAPNFTKYRVEDENSHLKNFPVEVRDAVAKKQWSAVSLYLRLRREDQDRNPAERDLNSLGAIMMCAQMTNWADLTGLAGHTTPSPAQSPRFSQSSLVEVNTLSAPMRAVMKTLGRGCTSEMAAVVFKSKPVLPGVANTFLFQEKDNWVWLLECAPSERAKFNALILGLKPASYSWDSNEKVSLFSSEGAPVVAPVATQ